MSIEKETIQVIGAGLAGSEAALVLAQRGSKVRIYEQKPKITSAAHKLKGAAELVCSNSLKSLEVQSSSGLLKEELRLLGSPVLEAAFEARVPGGKALSVDRIKLSEIVTHKLQTHPNIDFVCDEVTEIPSGKTIIATGPLTSDDLIKNILKLCGDDGLYFYDATSPIVSLDSLDLSKFFWASRNQEGEDYLNLPLNKEEYLRFREAVLSAEKVESHIAGEDLKFFEGCLPLEVLASRGEDVMACSCMKPSGFGEKSNRDVYAVIQFRREKAAGELLSMVAFQSRMKWPDQERVFRSLPGMQNAQFARLGAMHRNTFINAPLHLNERLQFKGNSQIFFAGQITGGEGYSEALATGHYAALSLLDLPLLPESTALRSLARYLVNSDPKYFQPMNFNFGLLPPIDVNKKTPRPQGVKLKPYINSKRVERSLRDLNDWIKQYGPSNLIHREAS